MKVLEDLDAWGRAIENTAVAAGCVLVAGFAVDVLVDFIVWWLA